MNNNIGLVYENGEFKITRAGSIIKIEEDLNVAIERFKEFLTEPVSPETISWERIENEMIPFIENGLKINNEYKTLTFEDVKYFYITGKVLSTTGNMIDLKGGYNLFRFAIKVASNGQTNKFNEFIDVCKVIVENKAILSVSEESVIIRSAKLSYGVLEYNFATNKINKGTSIDKGDFEEFKSLCFEIFNK